MSSSSEYSSGHRTRNSPAEKSTFSQTCSLLSQYLKEKGSFGNDLTLGMTRTVESNGSPETSGHSATTMELFPTTSTPRNPETMDFLTLAYPSLSKVPTIVKSSAFESVEKEPKASQLTIFYAGKVLVFDDFPADKVEELMSLVGKGKSQSQNSSAYAQIHNQQQNHPSFVPNIPPEASARPIESQSQNSSAYAQIHNQQHNHPSFVPNIPPEASARPIESQSQNSSAYAQIHNQQHNHPSLVPNIPPEASARPIESQSQNSSAYAQIHNQQQNHPSFVPNIPPEASARSIESQSQNSSAYAQIHNQQHNHPSLVPNIPPEASPRPIESQSQNSSAHAQIHNQQHNHPSLVPNIPSESSPRPIVHDHLPIARKASLHRFLKKRKDRISSKAPYQTNSPSSAPDKPVESTAWLGLSAKSTQN